MRSAPRGPDNVLRDHVPFVFKWLARGRSAVWSSCRLQSVLGDGISSGRSLRPQTVLAGSRQNRPGDPREHDRRGHDGLVATRPLVERAKPSTQGMSFAVQMKDTESGPVEDQAPDAGPSSVFSRRGRTHGRRRDAEASPADKKRPRFQRGQLRTFGRADRESRNNLPGANRLPDRHRTFLGRADRSALPIAPS